MSNLMFNCPICNDIFFYDKSAYNYRLKQYPNYIPSCSKECNLIKKDLNTNRICNCTNCNLSIKRQISTLNSKSGNVFCSKSCAATYNNKHKTYGTRRSKLEVYLEEQIRLTYQTLILECNSKSAIQSELDFYFPDLKLAIEINGIFHYEPIYGIEKFEKIKNNDLQKIEKCQLKNITLYVIDISMYSYFTKNLKEEFKTKVFQLINNKLCHNLLGENEGN